jgi:SAM-dependent methyltransferase
MHFVIASLFHLPFDPESFDLVYSEAVIHHAYSTPDAFAATAPRVRPGGHLFVWLYGLDDHLVPNGHRRNLDHDLERILRPAISDVQSPSAWRAIVEEPPFGVGMTGRRLEGAGAEGTGGHRQRAMAA